MTVPTTAPVPASTPQPAPPSTTGPARIHAESIRKSFPVGREHIEILHGISLEVADAQMVAVMGPSGSGKSTLMHCLAGLEQPTTGTARIGGTDLASLSRTQRAKLRRSDVGFLFQNYNLIPTLTAAENVAFPQLLAGTKTPREKIQQVLGSVGLGERAGARPSSMSGGEQQRVALARVIAQEPTVLFADEPTGALDTRMGRVVLEAIANLARTPGHCALIVTHDPAVAAACDRVVFLRDGLLVAQLQHPSLEQVAEQLTALTVQSEADAAPSAATTEEG